MQEELQHPQVTRSQLQLWLADPTTKKYLQCLEWSYEQNAEATGMYMFVRGTDEETIHELYRSVGESQCFTHCLDVETTLDRHKMLEPDNETPKP